MTEHVYFLKVEGRWKIGYSSQVKNRLEQYKTAQSLPIEECFYTQGTRVHERWAHSQLHKYRAQGEWFLDKPEVTEFIQRVMKGNWPGFEPPAERVYSSFEAAAIDAARIISECAVLCGLVDVAWNDNSKRFAPAQATWGVNASTIYKFLYRPSEPKMEEYTNLLNGVARAVKTAHKWLDDALLAVETIIDCDNKAEINLEDTEKRIKQLTDDLATYRPNGFASLLDKTETE